MSYDSQKGLMMSYQGAFKILLKVKCVDHNLDWICVLELWWDGHSLKKQKDLWHGVDVGEVA